MKKIEEMYESVIKSEKKFRNTQLVLCILIALISIPLFKIHFFLSGTMIIIIGFVLYLKIRQISFDRVKNWKEIIEKVIEHESKS